MIIIKSGPPLAGRYLHNWGLSIVIGILIYIQQDATLHSLLYLETALHVSGDTITHHQQRKQLYLQHLVFVMPVTTICRYRGRVGTGLSVLWVAYAAHSTFKPVPTLPR